MENLIKIDGYNFSVSIMGEHEKTLVFLPGFGMCSPILSFKEISFELSKYYRVVIIEKFGYGYSDTTNQSKDLKTVVNQIRTALQLCHINKPYILCPFSIAGLDALYWANHYPNEVEKIIGFDMTFPSLMKEYKFNISFLHFASKLVRTNFIKRFTKLHKDETYAYANLTESDKDLYKTLYYKNTLSQDMLSEAVYLKENIQTVEQFIYPKIPMLLFVSNGKETGIEENLYKRIYKQIASNLETATVINLNASHFIHLFAKDEIIHTILNEEKENQYVK